MGKIQWQCEEKKAEGVHDRSVLNFVYLKSERQKNAPGASLRIGVIVLCFHFILPPEPYEFTIVTIDMSLKWREDIIF